MNLENDMQMKRITDTKIAIVFLLSLTRSKTWTFHLLKRYYRTVYTNLKFSKAKGSSKTIFPCSYIAITKLRKILPRYSIECFANNWLILLFWKQKTSFFDSKKYCKSIFDIPLNKCTYFYLVKVIGCFVHIRCKNYDYQIILHWFS